MRRKLSILLLALGVAAPMSAQRPLFTADDVNLATHLREIADWAEANPSGATTPDQVSGQIVRTNVAPAAAEALDAIPQAVGPIAPFIQRAGLPSFASLFDLGLDSIEKGDGEGSFVVKLNETDLPLGALGISATVREASSTKELLSEVSETSRKLLESAIDSRLGDLDDLTFAAEWGLEKTSGSWRVGRRIDLYLGTLERAIAEMASTVEAENERLLQTCEESVGRRIEGDSWAALTRDDLEAILGEGRLEECVEAAEIREEGIVALDRRLDPLYTIGFLVDNQPQLVVTGLVHDRDPLAGRDGWEAKVEYTHGLCNLNKILNGTGCGDRDTGMSLAELRDLSAPGAKLSRNAREGQRFTFSARYAERDELRVSETFGSGDDAILLDVLLPKATERSGKLQYTRHILRNPRKFGDVTAFPKLHISAEYIDVSDDPKRNDRLVGQITYEFPVSEDVALPISLSYANHAEFLGDVDHELSAHFGFSYSFDTKKAEKTE